MKRNILYVVLCLTLTAPALAGCGNDAATPTQENSEASAVAEDVSGAETENTAEVSSEPETPAENNLLIEESVLCEQDGVKAAAVGLHADKHGYISMDLKIENTTEKNISIFVVEVKSANSTLDDNTLYSEPRLNMQEMLTMGCEEITASAGETTSAEDIFTGVTSDTLLYHQITSLDNIAISLAVFDSDTEELLFLTESAELSIQPYNCSEDSEAADPSAESNTTPDSEAITYTPCDIEQLLLDAYEDADAAAEKYADQYLEISGILKECEISDMSNPPGKIVRLEMPFEESSEHPFVSITAYSWDDTYISLEEFEKATEELSPGDAVKVYATAYYYDAEWKTVDFDLLGIEKQ